MTVRTMQYLIEVVLVIWTSVLVRSVVAATAVATITVTITAPVQDVGGLTLSSMQVDMYGKSNGELTITNLSRERRDVMVELVPTSAVATQCSIRYSPVTSSIPPGGYQVVRLMLLADEVSPCLTNYRMEIRDFRNPGNEFFSVPVYTAQNTY